MRPDGSRVREKLRLALYSLSPIKLYCSSSRGNEADSYSYSYSHSLFWLSRLALCDLVSSSFTYLTYLTFSRFAPLLTPPFSTAYGDASAQPSCPFSCLSAPVQGFPAKRKRGR